VSSPEIEVAALAIDGNRLYAAGYTARIPVIRQFDLDGRLLWTAEFPTLPGYMFSDLVATDEGVVGVATSTSRPDAVQRLMGGQYPPTILLQIDRSGHTLKEVPLQGNDGKNLLTRRAPIARWGRSIVVAVNRGTDLRSIPVDRSRLGMPWVCSERGGTYVTKLDSTDLKVTASQFIADTHIVALRPLGDQLYLAGEVLDPCAFS